MNLKQCALSSTLDLGVRCFVRTLCSSLQRTIKWVILISSWVDKLTNLKLMSADVKRSLGSGKPHIQIMKLMSLITENIRRKTDESQKSLLQQRNNCYSFAADSNKVTNEFIYASIKILYEQKRPCRGIRSITRRRDDPTKEHRGRVKFAIHALIIVHFVGCVSLWGTVKTENILNKTLQLMSLCN